MRRYGFLLFASALVALGAGRGGSLSAAGTPAPRLTAVTATAADTRAAVLIESSEPVAYAASRPDPFTVRVDLRNVTAAGYDNGFAPLVTSPVRDVTVEDLTAPDGSRVARVTVALAEPLPHRVRSQRNLIFVELDRNADVTLTDAAPTAAAPRAAPVAAAAAAPTVLRAVRTSTGPDGTSIVLAGDARLPASVVERAGDRLYIDLPGVTPAVPGVTTVRQGPIDKIRVALNSREPLVTRVVLDLSRPAGHTIDRWGRNGQDLRVLVNDTPAQAPARAAAPVAAAPAAAVGEEGTISGDVVAVAPPVVRAAPAPARAQDPAPAQVPGAAGKVYTGHPISLDFQGADLRAVLRTFAEISGLNIVIDPSVQGSVDVALKDVPWDQALDIILRANKLGYSVDGTIVRVAPLTVLAEEEKQRRQLAQEQALAGELRVITAPLSYATAEDVRLLLVKSALTQRGTVEVDARTNTLIISDLQQGLDKATTLIAAIDRPQPQVEIEARVVTTTRDFARSIGVEWGLHGRMMPELGNTTNLAFPNSGSLTGRQGGVQGVTAASQVPTAVSLGVPGASSALGLALGSINGSFNLDVALSALERSGNGKVLSTPRVSTQNNVEAEITQGLQIPIQTVANNTVTVTFKDAALTLKVTPQITNADTVIMRILVENASPDFSRSVNNIPPIDTQRANTRVLVANGETTVIGGIYVNRQQTVEDRTPALHRIPLLGWLFKRISEQEESRELLIFITPRIIR